MLDTLTIRGDLVIRSADFVSAYSAIEKIINGAQWRMLKQSEDLGWPIRRTAILDEFNGVRRSVFEGFSSLCLSTGMQNYSGGSSASSR